VLLTGARRGEVIGLERDRVGDVLDLSWQLLRLKKTDTDGKPDVPADYEYRHLTGGLYLTRPKSSSSWRVIPLIDPLRSILEKHMASTPENEWGLVFTRTGTGRGAKPRPYGPDLAGKDWRRILAAAGINKDVRLHDGRHTTVDLLYAAGVPDDLIQEIVGHSTRTMTQQYKSLRNRERLTAAMEQFSALFTPPASPDRQLDAPPAA
jgi:integrase